MFPLTVFSSHGGIHLGIAVLFVTIEQNNTSPRETTRTKKPTLTAAAVASYQLHMNFRKHLAMSEDCKSFPNLHMFGNEIRQL